MQVPKLRQWRELRALTQEEVAEKAGISVRSVAGYEAGAGARPGTVRKLADALGVEVVELLDSPKRRPPLEADVPPEAPTPKALAPPLDELLEEAGCKTRWLALSDEEWQEAYSAPTPEEERQKAIEIGREVQDEYVALRPDLVEGMKAERILYPKNSWFECPFGSLWIQTGRRYREAYRAARKALEGTDNPTDSGRFPPWQTPGIPETVSEDEPRYVIWEEVEQPELLASAHIP